MTCCKRHPLRGRCTFHTPFVFRIEEIKVQVNVTLKANKSQATEIKRTLAKQGIQVVLKPRNRQDEVNNKDESMTRPPRTRIDCNDPNEFNFQFF